MDCGGLFSDAAFGGGNEFPPHENLFASERIPAKAAPLSHFMRKHFNKITLPEAWERGRPARIFAGDKSPATKAASDAAAIQSAFGAIKKTTQK